MTAYTFIIEERPDNSGVEIQTTANTHTSTGLERIFLDPIVVAVEAALKELIGRSDASVEIDRKDIAKKAQAACRRAMNGEPPHHG
ncbi:hypothetical protein N8612_04825 [Verrucomicrobia bacterium]|nr:hypothetical protein [Verrucomicrobiota bacterium]